MSNEIAYRRVVPAGYHEAMLTLEGASALLMNSGEADRDGETFRAFHNLGRVRGKSLEQDAQLRKLEWTLALYHDEEIGPFLPGVNVRELLRAAATKWRQGNELRRSLVVVEFRIPVLYDGPRDVAGLWEAGYRDNRMVSNGGVSRGRVVRCRPRFDDWRIEATLAWDPEDLDRDFLELVVERSRKYGLGDGRSIGFGAFVPALGPETVFKPETNGKASKPIDRRDLRAHTAKVATVKK